MTTAAEFFAGREDSARLFETLRSAIGDLGPVEPAPGRFMHHLEPATLAEVDDEVRAWLREACDEAA